MHTGTCVSCDSQTAALERVRYYPRQLVDASDLTTDQEYVREKQRRHNRLLHGWGVVCGFDVKANPTEKRPWQVVVCPGYALTPQGDEINAHEAIEFDVAAGAQTTSDDPCAGAQPCPPLGDTSARATEPLVYLAARHTECYTRPERVLSTGCGCEETACEYARVREGFELKLLFGLPESHQGAAAADEAWCEQIKLWSQSDVPVPPPVPPCPACVDDPWVVLARISLPEESGDEIGMRNISYSGRRVLYSVSSVRTTVACV